MYLLARSVEVGTFKMTDSPWASRAGLAGVRALLRGVGLGFGRTVALQHRSSASYRIHEEDRRLFARSGSAAEPYHPARGEGAAQPAIRVVAAHLPTRRLDVSRALRFAGAR